MLLSRSQQIKHKWQIKYFLLCHIFNTLFNFLLLIPDNIQAYHQMVCVCLSEDFQNVLSVSIWACARPRALVCVCVCICLHVCNYKPPSTPENIYYCCQHWQCMCVQHSNTKQYWQFDFLQQILTVLVVLCIHNWPAMTQPKALFNLPLHVTMFM